MRRSSWLLVLLLLAIACAAIWFAKPFGWMDAGAVRATPLPVPKGDVEIAWLHTTTNAATWERFVTGVVRTELSTPGLIVDDSMAFLDSTTAVPEVVLSKAGFEGQLRIRWYKLQNAVTTEQWVQALAARQPAPIAIIGGGTTERAITLCEAMNTRYGMEVGPALLLTTATADDYQAKKLVEVYDDRTFRFCFTNKQMASAVISFLTHGPMKEQLIPTDAGGRVIIAQVAYDDDRYSQDLQKRFAQAISMECGNLWSCTTVPTLHIPFSIGGFAIPNEEEVRAARELVSDLEPLPRVKVLLVLPAVTLPAKRFLNTVLQADPGLAKRLVVVTGDGIPVNAILRDGDFAWPWATLPVPLLLFAHNNPIAWDTSENSPSPERGSYVFKEPNSTEEAKHFGEMAEVIVKAVFRTGGTLVQTSPMLMQRLNASDFFEADGERKAGQGEFVVLLSADRKPVKLTVWNRQAEIWLPVKPDMTLPVLPR